MEENKQYIAVTSLISSLNSCLSALDVQQEEVFTFTNIYMFVCFSYFFNLQELNAKRREIEEHFERCIHALEVRQQDLIEKLYKFYEEGMPPLSLVYPIVRHGLLLSFPFQT